MSLPCRAGNKQSRVRLWGAGGSRRECIGRCRPGGCTLAMLGGEMSPKDPDIRFLDETRSRLLAAPEGASDILDEFERQANEFAALSRASFVIPAAGKQEAGPPDIGSAVRLLVGAFRHAAYLRHA